MAENTCKFVSSHGFLKSCIYIPDVSTFQYSVLKNGDIVYTNIGNVPIFCTALLEKVEPLNIRIVLVTGDNDCDTPHLKYLSEDKFYALLRSPNIIHWFSINCLSKYAHPKLTMIPYGLDYHSISRQPYFGMPQCQPIIQEQQIQAIMSNSKPFWERQLKCFANFHFVISFDWRMYIQDRRDAVRDLPSDVVHYQTHSMPRINTFQQSSEYAFVISPHGNGLDCIRTWESLILGCIVIIRNTGLMDMRIFNDLPVWIVNSWSDVTLENMQNVVNMYKEKSFNHDKLTLKYWMDQIRSKSETMFTSSTTICE